MYKMPARLTFFNSSEQNEQALLVCFCFSSKPVGVSRLRFFFVPSKDYMRYQEKSKDLQWCLFSILQFPGLSTSSFLLPHLESFYNCLLNHSYGIQRGGERKVNLCNFFLKLGSSLIILELFSSYYYFHKHLSKILPVSQPKQLLSGWIPQYYTWKVNIH